MPLDPEIQKAIADTIKEQIPAVIGEAFKPLAEQIERIQYDNQKLAETISGFPQQIEQRFEGLGSSLQLLDQLKQEMDAEAQTPPPPPATPATAPDNFKQEYEAKLVALQKQLEQREADTQALREADRQAKMRSEVLGQMRALGNIRPNTEEDLFTLLEKRGLVQEDNGKLYIKGADKFGGTINAEFKEILPKMLEGDFAHFASPRAGTGTDGTPGNRAVQPKSAYNFGPMTAQEIYDKYRNDPEAMKAYNQMLEEQYKR